MLCATLMLVLMWSRYRQGLGLAATSTSTQALRGAASSVSSSNGSSRSASSPASGSSSLLGAVDAANTLQFDVCNGFTNQRIALMSGEAGRAARMQCAWGAVVHTPSTCFCMLVQCKN